MTFEDYFGIRQLISGYGLFLDQCLRNQRDWKEFTELFVEDAVFDMERMGLGQIVGATAITEAMIIGTHPAGHHVGNLFVHSFKGDTAKTSVKSVLVIFDGRTCTGTYDDVLSKTGKGWRFKSRRPWIETVDARAPLPVYLQ